MRAHKHTQQAHNVVFIGVAPPVLIRQRIYPQSQKSNINENAKILQPY